MGSWVCEGLIRSGVGRVTLIDSDDVCISNVNRQIQATSSTVGVLKADALRARMMDINPHAHIEIIYDFITPDNIYSLLGTPSSGPPSQSLSARNRPRFDVILDAADKVADKAVSANNTHLILHDFRIFMLYYTSL